MPPIARFAGILLCLTATLSPAAAPDPLPDQPGALTPEDLQAAAAQAKALPGSGAELPLVASGTRLPGQAVERYALFATPFAAYSPRVMVRTRILCNFFGGMWRCNGPGDEFQMSANGIAHTFAYSVLKGSADRQTAVDAVDFMYSPCFAAQFAALGGTPFVPSPGTDYVRAVTDDGNGLGIATGPFADNNSYQLQKTDRKADGCGFRIQHARIAGTNSFIPESYAQERAKWAAEQEAAARKQLDAEARARPASAQPARPKDEGFALSATLGVAALGALSLFVPLLTRSSSGQTRAIAAGTVAATCTFLVSVAEASFPRYDVPLQYLVYIPALLAAWLVFAVLAVRARRRA
jgi:hypothetical protein